MNELECMVCWVHGRKFMYGRNSLLAILSLCPIESGWDAVHLAQDIVKGEVAIGNRSISPGEIDSVIWRGVDRDVFERDIA